MALTCKELLLSLKERRFVNLVACLLRPPALLLLSSMVSSSSLLLAICLSSSCNTLLLLLLAQMLACWFCWSFSFPSLSPARTTCSEYILTMEWPVAKSWMEQQSTKDCMEQKFPKQGVRNDHLQNFQENFPSAICQKVATICKNVVNNNHIKFAKRNPPNTTICQVWWRSSKMSGRRKSAGSDNLRNNLQKSCLEQQCAKFERRSVSTHCQSWFV